MEKLKKYLPDVLAVVLFAVIAFAYFMPADLEGRILYQHDTSAGRGAGQEALEYLQKTGERTRWTNSTFGGMPTYQTSPSYKSTDLLSKVMDAYHLWLPENVWFVFAYLLGFYILMRAFDFRRELAVLGSIVWAFSSYFFIIIAAGHIWKVWALAYLPPMIAGIVLAYRGKYLWGFILTALFAAFEVKANHVQMTYYYLFPIAMMVVAFIVQSLTSRYAEATGWKHVVKATAVCLAAGAIGILINISNLYHTWEYSKETMRGKSELVKPNTGNQTSSGLERDYITQWSYGIGETWTLLIPNTKGGASVPLARNEKAMQKADPNYLPLYQQIGQYWGEQPMTSGPVYVGAFVLMLFVLGLLVVKGPMKWALLAATILSIMLSWGKNFMGLTDFFIDHVPLYAKFRTVSSILVVAEFTIPLLAMFGLKHFIEGMGSAESRPKMVRALSVSTLITVVICLFFALAPTAGGDCVSSMESESIRQQLDPNSANMIIASISEMRAAMLTADAWRSILIILVGAALLYAYYYTARKNKGEVSWKTSAAIGGLVILLCLVDMWQVNKRYMNDSMFHEPAEQAERQKTPVDEYILGKSGDKRDYRVFNGTVSTFNDNTTAFFYNSVGGYHPAKLRRYQELIESHITAEYPKAINMFSQDRLDTQAMLESDNLQMPVYDLSGLDADTICPVLNMLNTRWFIWGDQNQQFPLENTTAYGNAWFVDNVKVVDNANQELDALHQVSPRHTAVIDKQFAKLLNHKASADSTAYVKLLDQTSTTAKYEAQTKSDGVAVFSEIYYPGWEATIDGKPAEIARANYVLRAMCVPAGKHVIEMVFNPQSVKTTETVAYICLAVLLLAVVAACLMAWKKQKNAAEPSV